MDSLTRFTDAASEWRDRLIAVRHSVQPRRFDWYPYDSLSNFHHLRELFSIAGLDPLSIALNGDLLDVGCADGDVAFCLESFGANVVAIDHPRSNHNGMAGVRALRTALHSNIEILEMDIDRNMDLSGRRFGLALVLGLLYHVKNPLAVLDTVARHARYCVVSTRIARYLPGGAVDVSGVPVAYLLGAEELNEDNSNFWIFSEAGLLRLFERTHWRVRALLKAGDTAASLPNTLDHDERVFCLLESHYGMRHVELLEGWHQPEDSGWRWTASIFSARLTAPPDASELRLKLFVPDAMIERFGSVTLSCDLNGTPLASTTYKQSGLHLYTRSLSSHRSNSYQVRFAVDHCLPPHASDARELALVVADLSVE